VQHHHRLRAHQALGIQLGNGGGVSHGQATFESEKQLSEKRCLLASRDITADTKGIDGNH
jgi:hypothetical protein